jgi:hypothetical protein
LVIQHGTTSLTEYSRSRGVAKRIWCSEVINSRTFGMTAKESGNTIITEDRTYNCSTKLRPGTNTGWVHTRKWRFALFNIL